MVSRALTSFALGLALVACDGAKSTPNAAAEPTQDKPANAAAASDDGPGAAPAEKPVDITPAPADAETWMEFSSEIDRFEARLPAAPQKQTFDTPNPLGGTIPTTMYLTEEGSRAVGVGVTTVPPSALESFDLDGALDGARNGMVNNIGGTLVSEKQIEYAGHPARAIEAKATADGIALRIEARLFFAEPRLYQVLVVRAESEPFPAQKFFDSFSLLGE